MIQGGDITSRDGTGGCSTFGDLFQDENLHTPHDKPGLLSMANRGPGTNTSQYFITTVAAPWCNRKNVVFGEVVEGLAIVEHIQSYATSDILRRLSATILVEHSGLL
ncbi:cyclophilin-like domain-containing protein [Lactarius sanguifluus]|nr:cyclophilin-like domain-containing protein [Lactarius sanguifluus]